MRTVNQVSKLTGISIRTLHYYDEIGLFKPSKVTESGYRLYDEDALVNLQQILFFKELDFSLKDIRSIMLNPNYDKGKAYENQKRLIQAKRDRLDNLLNLLNQCIKGENCMSFQEFDMSEYFNTLEEFKKEHGDEIVKYWGSEDEFTKMTEMFKEKETEIVESAIKLYGSVEKYTEAMKKNLSNFPETMKNLDTMKGNIDGYVEKSAELLRRLTADLGKEVASKEIQQIVDEMINGSNEYIKKMNMGEGYWNLVIEGYLSEPSIIEVTDQKYGKGASSFIGEALKVYWSCHSF